MFELLDKSIEKRIFYQDYNPFYNKNKEIDIYKNDYSSSFYKISVSPFL